MSPQLSLPTALISSCSFVSHGVQKIWADYEWKRKTPSFRMKAKNTSLGTKGWNASEPSLQRKELTLSLEE